MCVRTSRDPPRPWLTTRLRGAVPSIVADGTNEAVAEALLRSFPDLHRIVLDPPRFRADLFVFFLIDGHDLLF